ncbi:hypothetical protein VTO73DRAFT_15437 [Trametes versicolor]
MYKPNSCIGHQYWPKFSRLRRIPTQTESLPRTGSGPTSSDIHPGQHISNTDKQTVNYLCITAARWSPDSGCSTFEFGLTTPLARVIQFFFQRFQDAT